MTKKLNKAIMTRSRLYNNYLKEKVLTQKLHMINKKLLCDYPT